MYLLSCSEVLHAQILILGDPDTFLAKIEASDQRFFQNSYSFTWERSDWWYVCVIQ